MGRGVLVAAERTGNGRLASVEGSSDGLGDPGGSGLAADGPASRRPMQNSRGERWAGSLIGSGSATYGKGQARTGKVSTSA